MNQLRHVDVDCLIRKSRAISNGKQVSVNDNILSVDGVAVFSLVIGFLRTRDTAGVLGSRQSVVNDKQ